MEKNVVWQVTRAGYMEVLTFVLTSYEENFDMLNRKDDENKAVIIANPRTSEFEVKFLSI
jgi:phenylalanyl-tRNA synthetase beta chain